MHASSYVRAYVRTFVHEYEWFYNNDENAICMKWISIGFVLLLRSFCVLFKFIDFCVLKRLVSYFFNQICWRFFPIFCLWCSIHRRKVNCLLEKCPLCSVYERFHTVFHIFTVSDSFYSFSAIVWLNERIKRMHANIKIHIHAHRTVQLFENALERDGVFIICTYVYKLMMKITILLKYLWHLDTMMKWKIVKLLKKKADCLFVYVCYAL